MRGFNRQGLGMLDESSQQRGFGRGRRRRQSRLPEQEMAENSRGRRMNCQGANKGMGQGRRLQQD